ncbi:alcohol dehydrogenase 2-like [Choristoneura fumiferana]|uniref:alcohol dehydrogenase 2-like n=1 Tax=Choristoneura fumiferana TaxID=7141 RepID=UPI003D15D6B8
MAKDLKNKVVVITGGAVGIGYEIGDKFLQKGAKLIIILDLSEKHGTEAVKKLNAKHGEHRSVFIKCDVTKDLEAVSKKIIDTHKHVDVLINNAGILDELSPRKTIEINVTALIEWSLKFWDHMRRDKGGNGGTIMNLASIYGYRVEPYVPVYQASKFAVMGFTRSLGYPYNYNRTGVRVVAINPGFTETALTHALKTMDDKELQDDFVKFLKEQIWQKVDAVANAAVQIFEQTESGTAWLIEGSRPIVEVK